MGEPKPSASLLVRDIFRAEIGIFIRAKGHHPLGNALHRSHGIPIIGVDDMMYLSQFVRGNAEIFEGENFTAEQVASGAKVCIISEMLAHINGISVGDKIDLSYYEKNLSDPNEAILSEGVGVNNPTSAYYDSVNTPLSPGEEYTVVGIYRKGDAWSVFDLQNITPNTMNSPKRPNSSLTLAYMITITQWR